MTNFEDREWVEKAFRFWQYYAAQHPHDRSAQWNLHCMEVWAVRHGIITEDQRACYRA